MLHYEIYNIYKRYIIPKIKVDLKPIEKINDVLKHIQLTQKKTGKEMNSNKKKKSERK